MKTFTKNNQKFICKNCGKEVSLHPSSSRDHCNQCLYSLHVDINPGDRENDCKGLMKPIGIELQNNKEKIIYRCKNCGEVHKNITAPDDNREEIIKLISKPVFV